MKVVEIVGTGGPDVLRIAERAKPAPGPDEVLIRVAAAGVNRPDIQQRRGLYPPPPGASDIPGLDIAGVVEAVGSAVSATQVGDAVCALVTGGGYAEYCVAPALQCMPIPKGLDFVRAAALPEVLFTAWNNVIWLGRLAPGESILIQGGTSGVGLAAIQLSKLLRGATVLATAGTEEKRQVCRAFGADAAFDYRSDWLPEVESVLGDRGIDVILDAQAGPYTNRELDLLAPDGRLVLIASHLGATAEVNVRNIVRRRLTLTGSTIRPRPPQYKGRIAAELIRDVWPLIEQRHFSMPICATFPLEQVADAHRLLDANLQIGKVVLAINN